MLVKFELAQRGSIWSNVRCNAAICRWRRSARGRLAGRAARSYGSRRMGCAQPSRPHQISESRGSPCWATHCRPGHGRHTLRAAASCGRAKGKIVWVGDGPGPQLVQRLSGPRAQSGCSVLLETRAIKGSASSVGADQRQVEPWPRDRRGVGRFVAPAQLEQIVSVLDHDGFPPRRPSAVVFGQHEMIDIDLVPILRQRMAIGGGIYCDRFVVLCLACGFR